MPQSAEEPRRPRVVIVGAGFGGLSAATALRHAPVGVTVIDRRNYHLFQPLLYQVATAGLSPADIASPIRSILRRQSNTAVMLATVTDVDVEARHVVADGRRIGFDYLVLATGARHTYFGNDHWERHAHGLKKIEDATFLRRKILLAFERAEDETDPDERRRLLNFVVVGGGPTGVEMAGAIAELARKALASDFRTIDPRQARIVLVQAAPRLLPTFRPSLSEAARRALTTLGVEVQLDAAVTGCDAKGVSLGDARIETRTIVWAAGVRASRAGRWLGAAMDGVGRVKVGPDLSVRELSNIFVVGDTAHALGTDGKPLPGLAAVAKQQGRYVANIIAARVAGKPERPFKFRDAGAMATIGRKSAVAEFGVLSLTGFPAWVLWCTAHIYFLTGFRNRIAVGLNWGWNYITFQRGTRLITGHDAEDDATESGHAAREAGASHGVVGAAGTAAVPALSTASAGLPIQGARLASRTSTPTAGE